MNADRRVRRDLAELLALRPGVEVVGSAADPVTGRSMVEAQHPDLIVVDPCLPGVEEGLAFVAGLREASGAWIVVMCHDPGLRSRAMAAGADVFVPESLPPVTLLDAIVGATERAEDAGPSA